MAQTRTLAPRSAEPQAAVIAIDPRQVPEEEYQTACRVLASSIRLALAAPGGRDSFEAWKQQRGQAR